MSHPRRRVLCAEPHEDTCGLITMLLERQGHEVVAANSIADCIKLAGRQGFDLYMLDDEYVDGDGLELCKRLRAMTPATPILFFSSRAFQRDRDMAAAAGAHAYLTKPDDIFEIVNTVKAILLDNAARRAQSEAEKP